MSVVSSTGRHRRVAYIALVFATGVALDVVLNVASAAGSPWNWVAPIGVVAVAAAILAGLYFALYRRRRQDSAGSKVLTNYTIRPLILLAVVVPSLFTLLFGSGAWFAAIEAAGFVALGGVILASRSTTERTSGQELGNRFTAVSAFAFAALALSTGLAPRSAIAGGLALALMLLMICSALAGVVLRARRG